MNGLKANQRAPADQGNYPKEFRMKRILAASASLAALALPAAAQAASPGLVRQYDHTYQKARQQFGPSAVGCNLTGRRGNCHVRVTDATLTKSLGVLDRLWAPPPAPVSAVRTTYPAPGPVNAYAPRTSYQTPHTAVYASPSRSYGSSYRATSAVSSAGYGGGYSIPSSIVQCESGGNWSAVNPSSGAGGAYQILPSTWQAYGGSGSPQNASPSEQSAIAAKIYAASGGSAWVCK